MLCFRNLELFNKALLAKNVWRIICFPTSLATRVLKASYFPDTCVLKAAPSRYASSLWNDLLWGHEVVCKGSPWQIGSGIEIDARNDWWILRPHEFVGRDGSRLPANVQVSLAHAP